MKIDNAQLAFASNHQAWSRRETRQRLEVWSAPRDTVRLSEEARAASSQQSPAAAIDDAIEAAENDPVLRLIRSMIAMLTGKDVRILPAEGESTPAPASADASTQAPAPTPLRGGMAYEVRSSYEEHERTEVSADGVVRTADGREIRFRLDLSMSRAYREEQSLSLRAGDAPRKDPLVLNFDGSAAQLSEGRFRFDLDGDGREEDVPLLAGGSAYLALDLNGNGRIDSGRELFGPATDSGFGELAALDDDRNGWIDENDSAFQALKLWTPGAQGAGALQSLQARGVGALAVAHVASPFELRGSGNVSLGAITGTGIYLTEEGRVGTVQEIDLSI